MSSRIETVRQVLAEAQVARGDRGCRLRARAYRMLCGIIYTPEDIADVRAPFRTILEAWLIPDTDPSPLTPEERRALIGLPWEYRNPLAADRPDVRSYAGNRHEAERIAKRMQKRAARRAERRDGNERLREDVGERYAEQGA